MPSPRMYPQGSQAIAMRDRASAPQGSFLVPTYDPDGNTMEAVTVNALLGSEPVATLTESGAIPASAGVVVLDNTSAAIAATIAAPAEGRRLTIFRSTAGSDSHTVTLAAGTWDGTNSVATFATAGQSLTVIGLSGSRFAVIANEGTVTFS